MSRGNSLQLFFTYNPVTSGSIHQCSFLETVCVAYLEADWSRCIRPRIFCDEMEIYQAEFVSVLLLGIIAPRYVQDVSLRIFFYDKPWTSTQSQSFPLSDGVEPESFVGTQLSAGFQFDNLSFFLSQKTSDEIVVIDFTEETDALAVLASGAGELGLFGYLADFMLQVTS